MGLIRKSLYLGTGGLVSPNSKKQRQQKQLMAAVEGKTERQIRHAGGRYDAVANLFPGEGKTEESMQQPATQALAQTMAYQAAKSSPERAPVIGTVSGSKAAMGGYTEFTLISDDGEQESWRVRNNRVPRREGTHGPRLWGPQLNSKRVRVYPSRTPGKASWIDLAGHDPSQDSQPEVTAWTASAEKRLAEVTRLHGAGVLTDDEYQAKRAEIISQL